MRHKGTINDCSTLWKKGSLYVEVMSSYMALEDTGAGTTYSVPRSGTATADKLNQNMSTTKTMDHQSRFFDDQLEARIVRILDFSSLVARSRVFLP